LEFGEEVDRQLWQRTSQVTQYMILDAATRRFVSRAVLVAIGVAPDVKRSLLDTRSIELLLLLTNHSFTI